MVVNVVAAPVSVDRETAAGMLGMSLSHFERNVQPHVRLVRSGKLRLIPVSELHAWVEKHAHVAVGA